MARIDFSRLLARKGRTTERLQCKHPPSSPTHALPCVRMCVCVCSVCNLSMYVLAQVCMPYLRICHTRISRAARCVSVTESQLRIINLSFSIVYISAVRSIYNDVSVRSMAFNRLCAYHHALRKFILSKESQEIIAERILQFT